MLLHSFNTTQVVSLSPLFNKSDSVCRAFVYKIQFSLHHTVQLLHCFSVFLSLLFIFPFVSFSRFFIFCLSILFPFLLVFPHFFFSVCVHLVLYSLFFPSSFLCTCFYSFLCLFLFPSFLPPSPSLPLSLIISFRFLPACACLFFFSFHPLCFPVFTSSHFFLLLFLSTCLYISFPFAPSHFPFPFASFLSCPLIPSALLFYLPFHHPLFSFFLPLYSLFVYTLFASYLSIMPHSFYVSLLCVSLHLSVACLLDSFCPHFFVLASVTFFHSLPFFFLSIPSFFLPFIHLTHASTCLPSSPSACLVSCLPL